jgi:hypothetical protein
VVVLSDHKRSGKRLIPPFVHLLGGVEEVSWLRTGLPEYLWLALAHQELGDRAAVEVISSLVRICRQSEMALANQPFAAASSYNTLSNETARIRELLASNGALFELQSCLRVLVALYPSCPMRWLFSETPETDAQESLDFIKHTVARLYDRSNALCVKVQATAVYLAFDAGVLKVREGLSLAQFPEIEDYPHTEISRKVAGSIRAAINMFLSSDMFVPATEWPSYFWSRSYSLSPCEVDSDE